VVAGKVMIEIAQQGGAGFGEPAPHPREVAHSCRVRQIVRQRPDAGEEWKEVGPRVGGCELDGLWWGRRPGPQECGVEVEKGDDDLPTIVQRGPSDDRRLKTYAVIAEQPRLIL